MSQPSRPKMSLKQAPESSRGCRRTVSVCTFQGEQSEDASPSLRLPNATILRAVHDKPISRVKPYSVAVSRKLIHQIGSPPNRQWPTGKVVTEIEKRILRNRVEKMFAVNESG